VVEDDVAAAAGAEARLRVVIAADSALERREEGEEGTEDL
jgi:hypothetical protein